MLATRPAVTAHERLALLRDLYRRQLEQSPGDYLRSHAEPAVVAHHVNVFEWYLPHLAGRRVLLDWGCNHGPDSCLLRQEFGESAELHACDFPPEGEFRAFRDFARPHYRRLTGPRRLPYEDDTFDAVIGSGVLEHTAMEGEALKELHRVLRPHGTLIITYLPYAYSWDEWHQRNVKKVDYHRRVFSRRGFARVLLSHGFEAQRIELQGLVPNRFRGGGPLWRLVMPTLLPLYDSVCKPFVRPVLYPFFRHTVLCGVARKMVVM
jgi:SAM-dependent methyltransferase